MIVALPLTLNVCELEFQTAALLPESHAGVGSVTLNDGEVAAVSVPSLAVRV